MEELNKKISGIRKMMNEMKTDQYTIVNPDLAALDEYTKALYLKVLCTVVQYENNPSDMQLLYLKRIITGIDTDEPLEEYMRKALEISERDIQEFIDFMKENLARYYFTLESMILVSMGNQAKSSFEYLAELIGLCGITKKDLEYLSLVAKSVLRQESSYFDDAKKIITEDAKDLWLEPYIGNYYAGTIIDTEDEKMYYAPDREDSHNMEFPTVFTAGNISFYNLTIEMNQEWSFTGCDQIKFVDCKLMNTDTGVLNFREIGKLQFENCEFEDFNNYVAHFDAVNEIRIVHCKFENCGRISSDKYAKGGVFELKRAKEGNTFSFIDNRVLNCYMNYPSESIFFIGQQSGILFNVYGNKETQFEINHNEFIRCKCIGSSEDYSKIIYGMDEKSSKAKCQDNRCIGNKSIGEVTRLM